MVSRNTRIVVIFLSVWFVVAPLPAQERREVPAARVYGEPPSVEDQGAIQALIDQYKGSWSRQDTANFIALHADNTEWINAYARLFQGAVPLAEFIENRLFPAFDSSTSIQEIENMRMISLRYLGGDAAVVHLYTEGQRGPSRNEGEDARRTHLHLVLEKANGMWKIAHTAIMDAR